MQRRITVAALALAFGSVALLGILTMTGHDGMNHCPLMGGSGSFCSIAVIGHIEAWQAVFVITAAQALVLFIAVFFIIGTLPGTFWLSWLFARGAPGDRAPHNSETNFLARALARGIVHPQLYA